MNTKNLDPHVIRRLNVRVTRSGKIFFWIAGILLAVSLLATFLNFFVFRNFTLTAQLDCDPYQENCFVHVCNPNPKVDGDVCTGDPKEDTWYTKYIVRMAYNMPECNPKTDSDCGALTCKENEKKCFYELCNALNVPEGDTCNNPEEYIKNNPPEEDDSSDVESSNDTVSADTNDNDQAVLGDNKNSEDQSTSTQDACSISDSQSCTSGTSSNQSK